MKKLRGGIIAAIACAAISVMTACRSQETTKSAAKDPEVPEGRRLFLLNCAHCHGHEGHGDGPDDGPDLRGITRSDEGIARMIKNGKTGQMPKFGGKFSDANIQSLVVFVRALPE